MFRKGVLSILLLTLLINYVNSAYKIKLKAMEPIEDIENPWIDLKDLKLRKFNKTHFAIDGVVSFLRADIKRHNLLISAHGAIKMSNGYQDTSLVHLDKHSFCEYWDNDKIFFEDIRACVNDTNLACPPPVGSFKITNFIPDTNKLPPNIPGKPWRLIYTFFNGDTLIGGFKGYGELENVVDLMPGGF